MFGVGERILDISPVGRLEGGPTGSDCVRTQSLPVSGRLWLTTVGQSFRVARAALRVYTPGMRPSPLLAAALLLAPMAARADAPEVHGKAVRSIAGCTEQQQQTLERALDRAAKKAETCLKDLNPRLAEKVLKSYAGFEYACSSELSFEGGDTKQLGGGRARVTMAFKTSGLQYDFEARLFHELLHAVDPAYALLGNREAHKRAGNTDVVYSCQLACYPGGIEAQEIKMSQKAGSVGDTPKGYDPKKQMDADSAYMMDDSEHRFAAETYASVCAGGKPAAAQKSLDKACLAQKMVNGCPKADDKGFCDSDAADDSAYCRLRCGGKDMSAAVDAAMKASGEIVAALKDKKGLSGEPASLLKQLKADKSLEACNK